MRVKFVSRLMGMLRGGGEIYDIRIAENLQKLGVDVSFVVGKPFLGKSRYPLEEFDTDYCASPYFYDLYHKIAHIRCSGRLYSLDRWLFSRSCYNLLKFRNDYDVLQVNGLVSLAINIKYKKRIPTIIVFQGPVFTGEKLIERADAIVAYGDALTKIRRNVREDAYDIPPGVDSDIFKPVKDNIREKYEIGEDKLLLFVGRLIPAKNIPFLIRGFAEAVKENKKIKLMLVGEGPLEEQIRRIVKEFGLEQKVIFTGMVPNDRLPQYYSAADAFIITSSYDNFPLVVLEAMSCCLPIIGTRVGGIPLQVEHGENGLLVENNDIKGLKNAILELVDNKNLAKEMGRRNRRKVKEKFSWLESAKKFKKIYESLL